MINAGLGWGCVTLGLAGRVVGDERAPAGPWQRAASALLATGAANVLYAVSLPLLHLSGHALRLGAGLWAAAAVTLPVALILHAWRPRWPAAALLAVPLACLLAAGGVTAWGAWH